MSNLTNLTSSSVNTTVFSRWFRKPLTGLLLLSTFLGAGCSNMTLKPWVSPFERNNLADPIMSFSRDPIAAAYLHHVYQAREGARGAEGGAGGGCGCN